MKVYIGDFKRWIGPYQIAEMLFFWVKKYDDSYSSTKAYDRVHEFGRWLSEDKDGNDSWLAKLCNWIHSKRRRKIKVRIDPYDTFNMDSTLAVIILPMLKQLKAVKHGSPGDMAGFGQTSQITAQKCFDFYKNEDDAAWEAGHKQWAEILDKMIWSFEQIQPDVDWESQYYTNGYDWSGLQAHQDRIQEGFELFGKYYSSLWD